MCIYGEYVVDGLRQYFIEDRICKCLVCFGVDIQLKGEVAFYN